MQFLDRMKRNWQARRDAKTEAEFGLLVFAVLINRPLAASQLLGGSYRFDDEELGKIANVFFYEEHPGGERGATERQTKAVDHFCSRPGPTPEQHRFVLLLSSVLGHAATLLEDPIGTVERAQQFSRASELKGNQLFGTAERMLALIDTRWLDNLPREAWAAGVDGVMEPILNCVEILFKKYPLKGYEVQSHLAPQFRRLRETRTLFGPFTRKCIERIEADPEIKQLLERSS